MADFLFELGLEEVPARMLPGAQAEFAKRTQDLLTRERLLAPDFTIESFSTPRRLAVLVHGILPQQADSEEDLLGPPVKAAYKDGAPTAAAHAFAKKAGVAVEALRTVTNPKGEYLAATVTHAGRSAAAVLTTELPKEIAALYWAKSMYWRANKPERFVRPVQWITALLEIEGVATVVPIEWAGIAAANLTYGHRILHGSSPVVIHAPDTYREALRAAHVLADVEERRQKIRKALDHVTRQLPDARWREDHPLVDKVTHLTEWPSVLLGTFEPAFLALPEEVLVTVMRDHQNYFAPQGLDGKLLPNFLAVLNTEPTTEAADIIRHNNERVLRARFNDARFFYDFDNRVTLEERKSWLQKVTFQKDLGSYADKTKRIHDLVTRLAIKVHSQNHLNNVQGSVDVIALQEAVKLCKTDLTTELVKEFTELQGVIGGLYAHAQGLGETISVAIYDHYLPQGMEDSLPRTTEGTLLSIADKADTIAGMFALGLQPTGSKDPFALRRAANGIVRMLAESTLPLTLENIAARVGGAGKQIPNAPATYQAVLSFFVERLDWYLRERRGIAYDEVNAVQSNNIYPELNEYDVRDVIDRGKAVAEVRPTANFQAICVAFKRMKNILEQARSKGEPIDAELLERPDAPAEETKLHLEANRVADETERLRQSREYVAALQAIATLRPAIDAFFEKVMVMDPDPAIRAARLGLLQRILNDFSRIADFSEIVTAG